MRCLVLMAAIWLSSNATAQVADKTCREWCLRSIGCFVDAAKAQGEQPRSKADLAKGLSMCERQCTEMGIPSSVLACLVQTPCKEVLTMDEGQMFKRCEPKGAPAIIKALELDSRTGDRCTDLCRQSAKCQLAASASPDFGKALERLKSCQRNCRESWQEPPGFIECLTTLSCADLAGGPGGQFTQQAQYACYTRATAGPGSASPPASPTPPAVAAKAAQSSKAGAGTAGTAAGSRPAAPAAEAKRLVGRWSIVPWESRNAPLEPSPATLVEFREDGTAVMTRGGLAQPESTTWTLDTSRAPRWLDLKVSPRAGEPGRVVPGLLEWVGTEGAAIQFFALGGSHPTQFQDMFTSKKQFMRRLPAEPAVVSVGERVVYRAPAWVWSEAEADAVFDPEDGESVARVVDSNISGARQVVWRTPLGAEYPVGGNAILAPNVTLSLVGFVNRRPVIEASPAYLIMKPPSEIKDLRKFCFPRPDGFRGLLFTGIPNDANTRIVRARLVRTMNGDPATQGPTGLYVYTARDFEGEKTLLRAIPYTTAGGDDKLEGPALGVDLGRVAYFDQASRKLVMVDGEVRDIAQGKAVDRIQGVDLMWWVDGPGAFYTLDAKESPARPWGVADDKSGAVVAGGKLGAELVLSRVEIDARWNARKVEAARAVVPAQGRVSPERTARNVDAAQIAAESGKPACPLLVFDPGPDAQGSDWYVMPSAEGPVLFFGKLWTTERQLMSLWLLVDPKRPGATVAVNYAISTTVGGYPAHLATFPASPDGNLLGIRPLYFLNGPGRVRGGTPFALDRTNGTIGPVASPSWRVKAAASSAPPAAAPAKTGAAPAGPATASSGTPSAAPGASGGKTCDDFCNHIAECARMVDSNLDRRATEQFRLDCLTRCKAGGRSQASIDCLASVSCRQGMSRAELNAAIQRCGR